LVLKIFYFYENYVPRPLGGPIAEPPGTAGNPKSRSLYHFALIYNPFVGIHGGN
jgi:hypothetical protein